MIAVIIAGGSGTRLWPLSTPEYPKHLLRIDGNERTLIQSTYDRAKLVSDEIYVVTERGHAHIVQEQLPDLPEDRFIIEPARRGTASCIIAALAYISKRHEGDIPVAILSADHFIRDKEGFVHSFRIASDISKRAKRIVLVGAEPDHPATGFGYIQKDELYDSELFVHNVHSFKEKPSYDIANDYFKSGNFLWNCGYFVATVDTFGSKMKQFAPDIYANFVKLKEASDDYEEIYLGFDIQTIDYGLIEKVDDLLVVPAAFDWMDLGSFGDLHKAVSSDERGNHALGSVELEGVENSFVQNFNEDKPLVVIGLDNVVVVNTKDGILVARKDLAQSVGEISKRIKRTT